MLARHIITAGRKTVRVFERENEENARCERKERETYGRREGNSGNRRVREGKSGRAARAGPNVHRNDGRAMRNGEARGSRRSRRVILIPRGGSASSDKNEGFRGAARRSSLPVRSGSASIDQRRSDFASSREQQTRTRERRERKPPRSLKIERKARSAVGSKVPNGDVPSRRSKNTPDERASLAMAEFSEACFVLESLRSPTTDKRYPRDERSYSSRRCQRTRTRSAYVMIRGIGNAAKAASHARFGARALVECARTRWPSWSIRRCTRTVLPRRKGHDRSLKVSRASITVAPSSWTFVTKGVMRARARAR